MPSTSTDESAEAAASFSANENGCSKNGKISQAIADRACIKCGAAPVVVLNRADAYCRDCFLHFARHKFRSTLGKHKVFKHGDRVVIVFDGGMDAVALVHLLTEGLSEAAHKKIKIHPILLLLLGGEEEQAAVKNMLEYMVGTSEWPCYAARVNDLLWGAEGMPDPTYLDTANVGVGCVDSTKLETKGHCYVIRGINEDVNQTQTNGHPDEFDSESTIPALLAKLTNPQESLRSLLQATNGRSKQRSLYQRLVNLATVLSAQELGVAKIVTPETMTELSIRVLDDLVTGRGPQIANDTCVADSSSGSATVVRALREFSAKELAYYCHFKGLHPVVVNQRRLMAESGTAMLATTLEGVSRTFISGLQVQFPATVSTVFSTAGKVLAVDKELSFDRIPASEDTMENKNNIIKYKCRICHGLVNSESGPHGDAMFNRFCYACVSLLDGVDSNLFPSIFAM